MINENIDYLNACNWRDWYLEKIEIDFENIIIKIISDSDAAIHIILKNYIGFEYYGHWDESVIKDINIYSSGDLISNSLEVIKSNNSECILGGGTKQLTDKWLQVNVDLIDNTTLKFVCRDINYVDKGYSGS